MSENDNKNQTTTKNNDSVNSLRSLPLFKAKEIVLKHQDPGIV